MKYITDRKQRPIYLQIYKQLRNDIIGGVYEYGSRLPSKRILAQELGVSTVTTEHAYELLCDEGYAAARQKSGFYVIFKSTDGFACSSHESAACTRNIGKALPYPVFSVSIMSKTMRRVLSDYRDILLEKSPNSGRGELQNAIRLYLMRNRGISVDAGQIIIGSGAEYLYGLIVELLGRDRVYAIESPSYHKLEQIYKTQDAEYELLPLSDDGIDSAALALSKADVLHTTPYRSYPTGITATASKRHEYIRWADKNSRYIIESDYGSEFSVSSQPTETLFSLSEHENVIYLNTFSKTISPSIRVGYMVLPKPLAELFYKKLGFYSCTVPTFEQLVLAQLINGGDFERHINRVRRLMRKEMPEI